MYTNIYRQVLRVYMAKLYWRVKIDGKWTWKPAQVRMIREMPCGMYLQVNLVKLEQQTLAYKIKKLNESLEKVRSPEVPGRSTLIDQDDELSSEELKQECGDND